jgi:hypothetical protein
VAEAFAIVAGGEVAKRLTGRWRGRRRRELELVHYGG